MQSIRSRIIIGLIRNRHLFKLQLKREVIDSDFSVDKFRQEVAKASGKFKMPQSVFTKKQRLNTMEAEWIIPVQAPEGRVLLYIHGGGFISGSCQTHRAIVAKFALGCQL